MLLRFDTLRANENKVMDFRQLRTFSVVAELGSLSKAADRLRVAQPALSRQIKLLEHELRAELFVRNGRGMLLTDIGRTLLKRTAGLVRQMEQVRDDIQSVGDTPAGRVVMGLVPTVSTVIAARFARRVVTECPNISLRLVESYGGHLVDWLHRGEIDLAVVYGPSVNLHLSVQTIGRDDMVVVGPKGSGLSTLKQVELDWLVQQKLILPSFTHGLRALIEKAVARRGLALDVALEADSYRVQISLVEEGLGYSVLPPSALCDEVVSGRLEIAPIAKPGVTRELVLASPIDRPPSIAMAKVSALIIEEFHKLVAEDMWTIRMES